LSSLTRDCITQAGGLVVRRVGFNNHKTESTIRVVPLSLGQHDQFAYLLADIRLFAGPDGDLLLRGKGDADGVQQDNRAIALWTQALKAATRDKAARPHSVRAATLEHLAWPGWELAARRLLVGTLSVTDARSAATAWTTSWVGLASASASAGHADIRAALGNYLAAWPIVHAVTSMALLGDLGASAGLVGQLGLSQSAYRQARSRATRLPVQASDKAHNTISGWDWIASRLRHPQQRVSPRPAPPRNAGSASTVATPSTSVQPANLPNTVQIKYVTLRCLGLPVEQAATRADLPWRMALLLDRLLPPTDVMVAATKRTKGASAPRGIAANLDMCTSQWGQDLRDWALSLSPETLEWAVVAFMRDMPTADPRLWQHQHNWQELAAGLPQGVYLRVAIGAAHITTQARMDALKPSLRYRLISDPKLGARPLVSIWPSDDNRVLAARITTLARLTVLACQTTKGATHAH
jgi:hypothetical protein